MSVVPFTSSFWPFSLRSEARTIRNDADALLRLCGDGALEAAELNALHEDFGFLPTARPGHWSRVAQEIARRSGQGDAAAALHLAA